MDEPYNQGVRDNCGIFGVFAPLRNDVAQLTVYGIEAMQHRGQESAGICVANGETLTFKKGMGFVSQVFDETDISSLNNGVSAIGHTRYSTEGLSVVQNAHPIEMFDPHNKTTVAVAHNGTIVGATQLRAQMEKQGCEFTTQTDTEAFGHALLSHATSWEERFSVAMERATAAYSLVILTPSSVMAARDPYGIRPLCVGVLQQQGQECYVVASESCAFNRIGAKFFREVAPGELVVLDNNGLHSTQITAPQPASCVFEQIYLAHEYSSIEGDFVRSFRVRTGRELARVEPVEADVVLCVPDSAMFQALGYSRESGIPQAGGIVKNTNVARTFISPQQRMRDLGAQHKYDVRKSVVDGKRVIVVDDSIVRGTTIPYIVILLKQAGAKEVHIRVASPPVRHPCHLGVDISTRQELVANKFADIESLRQEFGVDSLAYLSVDALMDAVGKEKTRCTGCFTGEYPV